MDKDILILTNDDGKRCTNCRKVKPLSHFYRSRRRKDSYQDWCIDCQREYRQARAAQMTARKIEAAPDLETLARQEGKTAAELRRLTNRVARLEKLIKNGYR